MDSYSYSVNKPSNYHGLPDPDKVSPLKIKTRLPPKEDGSHVVNTVMPPSTKTVTKAVSSGNNNSVNVIAQLNNIYSEIGKNNVEISEIKTLVNNFKLIFQLLTNKTHIFSTEKSLLVWDIVHKKSCTNLVYFLVDMNGIEIYPDEVKIIDGDALQIKFTVPQSGTVNLLFF